MIDHRPLPPPRPTTITRLETIQGLFDPRPLERILGPITAIDRQPVGSLGFSGSTHDRLAVQLRSGNRCSLVVKHVHLERAWTAYRTGDAFGREAALLGERQLRGIWEVFSCPYLAYAVQDGEAGLLMVDLVESLLPDVDAPLSPREEDTLLSALAAMHARYWEAEALDLPWLTRPAQCFTVLGPRAGEEESSRAAPHPIFELVARGWRIGLSRMPDSTRERLQRPVDDLLSEFADLPSTIVHGDAKVANFALLREGRVAAFDWAWIGAGPCTIDLGWYLAVNSGRLARPKEEVIARYRSFLEVELGRRLPDELWERLVRFGTLCAATMLLWEKALGLEPGSPGAIQEWDWWIERLSESG